MGVLLAYRNRQLPLAGHAVSAGSFSETDEGYEASGGLFAAKQTRDAESVVSKVSFAVFFRTLGDTGILPCTVAGPSRRTPGIRFRWMCQ